MGLFMSKEEKEIKKAEHERKLREEQEKRQKEREENERKQREWVEKVNAEKEEKQRQKKELIELRLREIEQKQNEREVKFSKSSLIKERIPNYCHWLNQKTNDFITELKESGINPEIGFEIEEIYQIDSGINGIDICDSMVFDIAPIKGIALDKKSKKMVYFNCKGGFINRDDFEKIDKIYEYFIIELDDIFNVKVEVDSITTYQSTTSNKSLLKRGLVGGVLLGEVGAIIGGVTAQVNTNANTSAQKARFIIQTVNPDMPIIEFEIKKPYELPPTAAATDNYIVDSMLSLFSNLKEKFICIEENRLRNNGSKRDIIFERSDSGSDLGYSEENYNERLKKGMMNIVIKRFNMYAMVIESIIKHCDLARQKDDSTSNLNNSYSIADELKKLSDLKEAGIINEDEFLSMKTRLISG